MIDAQTDATIRGWEARATEKRFHVMWGCLRRKFYSRKEYYFTPVSYGFRGGQVVIRSKKDAATIRMRLAIAGVDVQPKQSLTDDVAWPR